MPRATFIVSLCFIGGLVTTLAAEEPPGRERHGIARDQHAPRHRPPMVDAAFLGVTAAPVDLALGSQLRLPPGVGLVVNHVVDNSPAEAAGLRPHDVLFKLEDQLLINAEQLAVLVRTHDPGDSVQLTIIRRGKRDKADATLGKRSLPPLGPGGRRPGRPMPLPPGAHVEGEDGPRWWPPAMHLDDDDRMRLEQFLRRLDEEMGRQQDNAEEKLERLRDVIQEGKRKARETLRDTRHKLADWLEPDGDGDWDAQAATHVVRWKSDDGLLELRSAGHGAWHLTVFGADGKDLARIRFKDLDNVPEDLRPRVRTLMKLMDDMMADGIDDVHDEGTLEIEEDESTSPAGP